jgi:hypothetical protein
MGFWIFAAAMVVTAIAWVWATPFTIRHPRVIQFQRLLEHLDPKPGAFSDKDISPHHWRNGRLPETVEYKELEKNNFVDWRLKVYGLVEHPMEFSLEDLKALPYHDQISQHFCIRAWSGVAKWGGVQMKTIMDIVRPLPEAEVGGVLFDGPRRDGRHLLQRPSRRADEPPHDHAGLQHERPAAPVHTRQTAAAAQRVAAGSNWSIDILHRLKWWIPLAVRRRWVVCGSSQMPPAQGPDP